FEGVVPEHVAVRTKAGLFDVSHMGEILLEGRGALATVQYVTSNDASKLAVGQAQYSALTTPGGAFVDDILVHRLGEERFFLCVNAANATKDFEWIKGHTRGGKVENVSDDWAQIAVQGPSAAAIVQQVTPADLAAMRWYWFAEAEILGTR